MFHPVSWQTYFIAFAIVAGLYYIVVIVLLFRKGFKNTIGRLRMTQSTASKTVSGLNTENKAADDYTTYQSLRDEMTAFLEGAEPEMFKSDILFSLASIIKKHSALTDERFQQALNTEIRRMYLQKYNDGIEDEELLALWQV